MAVAVASPVTELLETHTIVFTKDHYLIFLNPHKITGTTSFIFSHHVSFMNVYFHNTQAVAGKILLSYAPASSL